MTPERWQEISEVLNQARELPTVDRPTFLDQACGDDPALRAEVVSLLEHDEQPAFIDRSVVDVHGRDPEIGRHIGRYEVMDLLGRGGMGAVYLARRQDDYQQQVALKLIKRGMDSDEIIRRFQNERQILANLDHPNIARLLDGGTASDGRPYLVMEYVEGEPIDRYCDRRRLSTRERLKLFLEVCSAIQLSHQKLVVHRDLKPGNILVSAEGVPKLLDFGIAKLLEPELAFRTLATVPGHRPMTLRYASPEQARGEIVTTATDTYSLGVLLYRLLTGHHPNDLEDTGSNSHDEVVRRICQHEPRKPSTAIRSHKEIHKDGEVAHLTPELVSRTRDGDPAKLGRRLRGDVDAILLRALRKEPPQRYGSVEQFAEDIRRYLGGLPVVARKGTFTYRAAKFVQRNRLALGVLVLILGFSVTSTVLWQKAAREGQRADRTLLLLKDLFRSDDPSRPASLSTESILERGTRLLDEALMEDPEQWAEMVNTVGGIYRSFGLVQEARRLMEESLEIMRRRYSGDHPLLAERINNLAVVCYDDGDNQIAEQLWHEALAMRRRLGQKDTIEIVKTLNNLASIVMLRGDFTEAEELYRRGLKIRVLRNGLSAKHVATSLRSLANLFYVQGEPGKAEPLLRRALQIRVEKYGDKHKNVASVLDKLGSVRLALGHEQEAEALFNDALDIQLDVFGEEHPAVARTQINLAALLLKDEASPEELDTVALLLHHALSTLRRNKSDGDWEIARGESLLGAYLTQLERYAEAEPCLIESDRVLRDSRGPDSIYSRAATQRVRELYEVWSPPAVASEP